MNPLVDVLDALCLIHGTIFDTIMLQRNYAHILTAHT